MSHQKIVHNQIQILFFRRNSNTFYYSIYISKLKFYIFYLFFLNFLYYLSNFFFPFYIFKIPQNNAQIYRLKLRKNINFLLKNYVIAYKTKVHEYYNILLLYLLFQFLQILLLDSFLALRILYILHLHLYLFQSIQYNAHLP